MDETLIRFLKYSWIKRNDSVLVVCGGEYDDSILKKLRFKNYLITSAYSKLPMVKNYQKADAQKLPFKDKSFDLVIVNAGLHHCASPHKALCEMYRVAKKAIVVREAQDSVLVRLMVKLKLVLEYEFDAVDNKTGGGVDDTSIPNFVYRWTKREVRKTLNSFDPTKNHVIHFYSQFHYYPCFLNSGLFWEKKAIVVFLGKKLFQTLVGILVNILNLIAKDQGNDFTFIVRKNTSSPKPWIKFIKNKPVYLPK